MSKAYYNEIDPRAAVWIRELIADGLIPDGEVDERSIADVAPGDLKGFAQCHFFAGIAGWPYALRLAGWPDEEQVWTGSCPCQPFSSAGKRGGTDDARHLWPAFRWLIAQCRPTAIYGEQVASAAGRAWLAGVRSDMEVLGYAVGAADLCAASVGAPHIRQRLFWVAECGGARLEKRKRCTELGKARESVERRMSVDWTSAVWWPCRDGKWRRVPGQDGGIPDAEDNHGWSGERGPEEDAGEDGERRRRPTGRGGDTQNAGHDWMATQPGIQPVRPDGIPESVADLWAACDADLFPLAPAEEGRTGLLKGAGNAIEPHVAAEFIGAYMETTQ